MLLNSVRIVPLLLLTSIRMLIQLFKSDAKSDTTNCVHNFNMMSRFSNKEFIPSGEAS